MANLITKSLAGANAFLDSYIEKAKSTGSSMNPQTSAPVEDRKSLIELNYAENEQHGYREKMGMVGPSVLRNMARKNIIVVAIHQTRMGQIEEFTRLQRDRYSPGWLFEAEEPADISKEDKIKLADPTLEEDAYNQLKYDMEKKKNTLQIQQAKDIKKLQDFVKHCGLGPDERDTTYKRVDFGKFCKLVLRDRLTYNYGAVELIPTKGNLDPKGRKTISHFYPVSAGTIKYISRRSGAAMNANQKDTLSLAPNVINPQNGKPFTYDESLIYRYAQVVRGVKVAAWPEEHFVFEAANPTIDPEDNGYAVGELEYLIMTITAHLYAEAHNRNFFTQGIGTKGLLHIKGDNISRGQLEAFKRQWQQQLTNTKNAFRPPIIGMADEVKWIPLAQTNQEMQFEQWMNYLIRVTSAVYQIDPSEINFDISKINTSTLNESSNETRIKSSRDKGLKPLLNYMENIMNLHILPAYDLELASKYKFKFVGLDAESKQQEIDRLQKETQVYKTVNEVRTYMGMEPIEDGDIILAATYTQYKQMKLQQQQADAMADQGGMPGEEEDVDSDASTDADLESLLDEVQTADITEPEPEKEEEEKPAKKDDKAKKSMVIEYHHFDKKE